MGKTKVAKKTVAQSVETSQHPWTVNHKHAMNRVQVPTVNRPHEAAIVAMVKGWVAYANAYHETDWSVGNDNVLGPHWEAIGYALKGLLDGETGRLDCGTLNSLILDTLKANGCEVEE